MTLPLTTTQALKSNITFVHSMFTNSKTFWWEMGDGAGVLVLCKTLSLPQSFLAGPEGRLSPVQKPYPLMGTP